MTIPEHTFSSAGIPIAGTPGVAAAQPGGERR